ncbi:MAG: NADH:flavin oxidoreductase/NADH oxidase, partial [Bdellovibrionales bacterium]|nr:NADH:flavin oxidoreductase/NADH oxidase [Oligoflexia bacterium]
MSSPLLFTPLTIRNLTFKNRIFMSPMCQYSAVGGVPNEWHAHHWAARAVGGVGLVIVEASAVCPEGRISLGDTGLWNETQKEVFERMIPFVKDMGARIGIQIAHGGRKSSRNIPWEAEGAVPLIKEGWISAAPSEVPFGNYEIPHALTLDEIKIIIGQFRYSAKLALEAGFEVLELHFAHGYLVHEFLSPLSNQRKDQYGGSFENRSRLALEITKTVREVWPATHPLFVRISASDWKEGGWTLEESIKLSSLLKALGVDLIDCSSGGLVHDAKIPVGPGYQVPFARQIKSESDILTGAVGIITNP